MSRESQQYGGSAAAGPTDRPTDHPMTARTHARTTTTNPPTMFSPRRLPRTLLLARLYSSKPAPDRGPGLGGSFATTPSSSSSELGVGELAHGTFRIAPLRRHNEDLPTMRARLLCASPPLPPSPSHRTASLNERTNETQTNPASAAFSRRIYCCQRSPTPHCTRCRAR